MMRFVSRDRLLFRVILHGVLLASVSAVGFLVIALVLTGAQADRDISRFVSWIGREACDEARHQSTLDIPAVVVVFAADGSPQASSSHGTAAVPAASASQREALARGSVLPIDPGRFSGVSCADGSGRYAVVAGPPLGLPAGRLAFLVLAMLVLVAFGSIPLARSLVRPLHELVGTVHRVGAGDLTARARATRTDEIGDLATAFNGMADNLQRHLMAERELLANVSHELRTPLARLRVVLETAREDPSRAAALLEEISRDLTDLERLTDDVLVTIRLDFDGASSSPAQFRVRPERIDVVALLQRVIARTVEAHPDREIALDAADAETVLHGDPSLLLRLFANLVDNARKYSAAAVTVRLSSSADVITVVVEDDGIGVAPDELERIFEPFFRSDRSRGRATGGTGLGLTLSRRVVEVHGGTIDATSAPGAGTRVTVRLPVERSA